MADWVSIKAEYLVGNDSLRVLAEKHGVSHNTLRKRAEREKWTLERKKASRKVAAKITQKIATKIATREVDRLTRLLSISDDLADKLCKSAAELGTYTIIKRKSDKTVIDENGEDQTVEETEEIAKKTDAVISTADLKRLASALKDLRDVANTPRADEQSLEKIRELMSGLDKEAADGAVE